MSRTMTVDDVPTTPCPPWCEQIQCQETDPVDRYHQRLMVLPVVYREVGGTMAAAELAVVTFTSATRHDDIWIGLDLGEDVASLTLSMESTERLHHQLAVALEAVRGRP